jgi:DNA modification methylase
MAALVEHGEMKPYYEQDGITIYHGDCREVLPSLKADLLCSDPPYGISLKRAQIVGDDCEFDPAMLLGYKDIILWGANNFTRKLPFGGWLCWDKRCSVEADRMYGSAFELAWCNDPSKFKMFRCLHGGVVNADGPNVPRVHPTQKPTELMHWCLGLYPKARMVLDPYMGSGTTLVAAKNLGRKAIGIELEERYCEIAANRLRQRVLEFA